LPAMRNFDVEYDKLIAEYTAAYGELTRPIIEKIIACLKVGVDPKTAVNIAFQGTNFSAANENALIDILVQAAANGYGVSVDEISDLKGLRNILLYEAWAPDKMSLSSRLHGQDDVIKREVTKAIFLQMKRQANLAEVYKNADEGLEKTLALKEAAGETGTRSLSRQLYEGYGSTTDILKEAELPEYLKRVEEAARKVASGDMAAMKDFNKAIGQAKYQVEKLSPGMAPTKEMKQAYKNLLDAAEKAIEKLDIQALDNAVNVAVQEKSRYYADRIARTELATAWGEAFFTKTLADPDTIAYSWKLGSGHNVFDICDFHANADLYGLGKGVYPKNRMPPYPAHPHCKCVLSQITKRRINIDSQKEQEMLDNAEFSAKAGKDYIKSLSERKQIQLLGVAGANDFSKTGEWELNLNNWRGHADPTTRFTANDFDLRKFTDSKSIFIDPKKTYNIDYKLESYSLNVEHKVGKDKAIAFSKALGYNIANSNILKEKILEGLTQNTAKFSSIIPATNNEKYIAKMQILGVNGRQAPVITVWELEEDGRFRMVTAYVDKE
jgi:hypothetical protein